MSIFSGVVNAEHTFVAWLEKEWSKFQTSVPSIETSVENGSNYAVGVLKIVASQVEAGSPAAAAISKAIADILTASAVVYDAGAHPTVASLFQDVVANLSGIESLAGIKSPSTVATIGKVVSTISAIASALLQIAPAGAAA